MGLPGKPKGFDGGEVERYFREGKIREIAEYCETAGRIANPRLHQLEREESRLAIREEIALQGPKTVKFDYLNGPNHSAHSIAFKFFTDD